MAYRGKFILAIISIVAVPVLVGCAIVDQYSDRALSFNTEAERAQQNALLMNVVRASLRRPMQFTTVQTINGTASASGNASLSAPLGAGGAQYKTGLLGTTISGGPTFMVPVLDTQEFYLGILNPIPGQIFDLFVQRGYPRELLLNLFIQKIVVTKEPSKECPPLSHWIECELTFDNLVSNDVKLDAFQALVSHLVRLGLSTERRQQVKADKSAAKSAKGAAADDTPPSPPPYVFCFEPKRRQDSNLVGPAALCGATAKTVPVRAAKKTPKASGGSPPPPPDPLKPPEDTNVPMQKERATIEATAKLSLVGLDAEFFDTLRCVSMHDEAVAARDPIAADAASDIHKFFTGSRAPMHVTVKFYTRPAQGVLYYLGELARRKLTPEYEAARVIKLFDPQSSCVTPRLPERPIFVVERGVSAAFLSVNYDGSTYSIPDDNDAHGYSYQVLDIAKQLLAVNTSSKSLPQTSVISLVNP